MGELGPIWGPLVFAVMVAVGIPLAYAAGLRQGRKDQQEDNGVGLDAGGRTYATAPRVGDTVHVKVPARFAGRMTDTSWMDADPNAMKAEADAAKPVGPLAFHPDAFSMVMDPGAVQLTESEQRVILERGLGEQNAALAREHGIDLKRVPSCPEAPTPYIARVPTGRDGN